MVNLDLCAAEKAQAIVSATIEQDKQDKDDVDNLATKTLGVLQENGVYAAVLFLHSRTREKDQRIAEQISRYLLELLPEVGVEAPLLHQKDVQEMLKFLSGHVLCDLDQLLLVKRLWEQTLVYARYGAKAWEDKE